MNIIGFVISFVLFVGGLYVMGEAFAAVGIESLIFCLGLLLCTAGVALPVHIMKRIDA